VAVLITAVVDKVGTFAMLRWCLQLFPAASKWATPVILVLAVISIIYGRCSRSAARHQAADRVRVRVALRLHHPGHLRDDQPGQSGATLYMVNHGISTAALMLVAGFLISRRGSRLIADFGGVQKVAPVLAGTFLVGGLPPCRCPDSRPSSASSWCW